MADFKKKFINHLDEDKFREVYLASRRSISAYTEELERIGLETEEEVYQAYAEICSAYLAYIFDDDDQDVMMDSFYENIKQYVRLLREESKAQCDPKKMN